MIRIQNGGRVGALAAALLLIAGLATDTRAAVIVTAVATGGDVVLSLEAGGSINLAGLNFAGTNAQVPSVDPSQPFFTIGAAAVADVYIGVSVPGPFGAGLNTSASSGIGDIFSADGSTALAAPLGYVSGSLLSGSATFAGQTYASLGMTPGTYVWTLPNDTITLNITAIPVPAAIWLFGSALGILGWLKRRA